MRGRTRVGADHAAGAMQEVLAAPGEAHLRFVWVTIVESETVELARDLNLHKEHVAAEYVRLDALTEVTAAINRLGDRLDNLFIHLMSQSGAQQ